ncbi:MAG TPA: hypothetical protein VF141_01605 [Chryseolinea sp.]
MKLLIVFCFCILSVSCATLREVPEANLKSDYYYTPKQEGRSARVYVDIVDDSIRLIPDGPDQKDPESIAPSDGQLLFNRSFDIDVMTVPFKYRPATQNLPRQLTVDFNGSLFFGYRVDQYKLVFKRTPAGIVKKVRHRAVTLGAFGGIGTTPVTPWTTNGGTTDEYTGFIFNRGVSLMGGVNNLTVGFGVGWDYLTDRDKEIWIYQNKPWYGLTVSLNLN